ncbi:helix-turn-helix domain-containing protein, partial [Agathobacter ruminis]
MNERNINQKQLSQLSGINESSISRYLHSGQKPRMDVVVNIAKALQV